MMRLGYRYLHYCQLWSRKCTNSTINVPTTAATAALRMLRRHITSFKGQPQDFLAEVNKEKAALVYFYTSWCKPCDSVNVKLEALWTEGQAKMLNGTDITSSSSSTSKKPLLSSSTTRASDETSSPCSSCVTNMFQNDPDTVLKSAHEICLRAQALGKIVCLIPIDTDLNPKLGALHDVRSVPTFVTYRDGHIVGRVEGSSWEQVWRLVKELLQEGDGDSSNSG